MTKNFLENKIVGQDVLLLRILNEAQPQILQAKIEKIYSNKLGTSKLLVGDDFEFTRAGSHWGADTLKPGQRAIVFISFISERWYEDSWQGHFQIEEIDGKEFAIFPRAELWLEKDIPEIIKENSKAAANRPNASAIDLTSLENYLSELISMRN